LPLPCPNVTLQTHSRLSCLSPYLLPQAFLTMDQNQHNQQGLYTLHHIAEQAGNPEIDPQVVLQHLQSTMHNVDILQQQMAAMVAAPTSSSTPVAIEETLQTLANNQVR